MATVAATKVDMTLLESQFAKFFTEEFSSDSLDALANKIQRLLSQYFELATDVLREQTTVKEIINEIQEQTFDIKLPENREKVQKVNSLLMTLQQKQDEQNAITDTIKEILCDVLQKLQIFEDGIYTIEKLKESLTKNDTLRIAQSFAAATIKTSKGWKQRTLMGSIFNKSAVEAMFLHQSRPRQAKNKNSKDHNVTGTTFIPQKQKKRMLSPSGNSTESTLKSSATIVDTFESKQSDCSSTSSSSATSCASSSVSIIEKEKVSNRKQLQNTSRKYKIKKKKVFKKKDNSIRKNSNGNTNDEIQTSAETDEDIDKDLQDEVYCYCKRGYFGKMIGCDNQKCEITWFHFECVSIEEAPSGSWYCPSCVSCVDV